MDVFKKVKEIVVEQLGCEEEKVTMNACFIKDLEADSLDIVELLMCFEEEFNVEIADEEAEKLLTICDAVNYIKEKL
ncbi:MAG: acyl carrier protein [Clostridiales bacterium]|jgi:acyl carrier protein|nr:acyl carrier protein [Clostridiales bacterium]